MIFRPLALAALLMPVPAFADGLMVADAWVPAAPPTATAHAAYITLHNHGDAPRILTGVEAASHAMSHLHESKETDGVSTMAMLHQIEIPAGGSLTMQPGGLHVMLMRPELAITEGMTVTLNLTFANGENLTVDAIVKTRNEGS